MKCIASLDPLPLPKDEYLSAYLMEWEKRVRFIEPLCYQILSTQTTNPYTETIPLFDTRLATILRQAAQRIESLEMAIAEARLNSHEQ